MAGVADLPDGSVVYLDTAPLIYVIEDHPRFARLALPVLQAVDAGRVSGLASVLTLTEVLVKPLEQGRADLVRRYRRILGGSLDLRAVTAEVAEEAARIRATGRVRLADAVHLATARLAEVDIFLTNDERLKSFREVRVVTLTDLT